jgi:hypothetical protein
MLMPVEAIHVGATNADLIVSCAHLGYLREDWLTLDPTYGLGRFWRKWAPKVLVGSDLEATKSPSLVSEDATCLRHDDNSFMAVALDPPYKLNGTANSGGPASSDSDYGVDGPSVKWQDRHKLICDMVTEAARICAAGGTVLLKCQDQVCSGKIRWQTIEFTEHAETCGLRLVDQLLLEGSRKQPEGRRQIHARRNYSSLLIFRKEETTWRSH